VKYFEVLLKLKGKADAILRPGKMVRARITVAQLRDALVVPRSALTEESRRFFVWVDRPQGPERRQVEVGSGDAVRVALLAGVHEGESVLLNPPKVETPQQEKDSTASALSNTRGAP
jgi:hypothetical protein